MSIDMAHLEYRKEESAKRKAARRKRRAEFYKTWSMKMRQLEMTQSEIVGRRKG